LVSVALTFVQIVPSNVPSCRAAGTPANAFRIALHPDGMAPRIHNFEEGSGHFIERHTDGSDLVLMHRLRLAHQDLSFFSTVTTFGTAVDITLAELRLEAFYPADARTRRFLSC
jgi:hypothetical protein